MRRMYGLTTFVQGGPRWRWARSLRMKMIASISLIFCPIVLFLLFYYPAQYKNQIIRNMQNNVHSMTEILAYSIAPILYFQDRESVQEILVNVSKSPDIDYCVVTEKTGGLFASVGQDKADAENYAELTSSTICALHHVYRTGLPILMSGKTIGKIHVGINLRRLDAEVAQGRRFIILTSTVVLIVGIAFLLLISTWVTWPLRRMMRTVERIRSGDLSERVKLRSKDETSELAEALNLMLDKLEESQQELKEINANLEQRIRERTKKLRQEIQERETAEQALGESEKRFRSFFLSITEGAAIHRLVVDRKGKVVDYEFLDVNPCFEKILGIARVEILNKRAGQIFKNPDARFLKMFSEAAETGQSVHFETRFGPEKLDFIVSVIAFEKDMVASLFFDITERKKAVDALRESEEKHRLLFENMAQGVLVQDDSGTITLANPAAEQILGQPKERILGNHAFDAMGELVCEDGTVFPQDRHPSYTALRNGQTVQNVVMGFFHNALEEYRWISVSSVPQFRTGGKKLLRVYTALTDITERKHMEDALRRSEAKYRLIADNISDVIWTMDLQTRKTYVSPSIDKLTGFTVDEDLGQTLDEKFTPESAAKMRELFTGIGQTNEDGRSVDRVWTASGEFEYRRKDGGTVWAEIRMNSIRDPNGRIIGIQGVSRNVMERRKSEEQIKTSLKEKELLLKEIHHRVKNNLQIISSLLSLQSRNVRDQETLKMFKESQSRVRSMALIHEKLYRSQDFTRIDFAEYSKSLITSIHRSYSTEVDRVRMKVMMEDVFLGIDAAVPCGLIINELVSNALKHAFPPSFKGKPAIEVSLSQNNKDHLRLVVRDNGIGLPEGLDLGQEESLGLRLVMILAEDQLDGKVKVERTRGTCFEIVFKMPTRK